VSRHIEALSEFFVEQCKPRRLRGTKKNPATEVECSSLELVHAHVEGGQTIIMQLDIADMSENTAHKLATRLVEAAQEHAHAFNLTQTYGVHLLWDNTVGAEYPMRFGGELLKGELEPTEPANAAGVISQQMRHGEALARTNAQLTSGILTHMSQELRRKDDRIERLENRWFQMLETMEVLATKQHERELSKLTEERKQRRIDDGLRYMKLLAPSAINGVCKKFGIPLLMAGGVSAPSVVAMKEWLKSLSEAQLLQILAASAPEQQAALLNAYKELALADEQGFQDLAAKSEKEGGMH
jgi:hypothetical protein